MRCIHHGAHVPEDCPGSGPAGREVERVDRSSALPLAQADDELDRIESRLEGRGVVQFPPSSGLAPGAPPISLLDRRRDPYRVRRTDSAEDQVRSRRAAVQLAKRQGITTIEHDVMDEEAWLLHEAALMRVIEWASVNGPECTCAGRHACPWHAGLAAAMEAEETA